MDSTLAIINLIPFLLSGLIAFPATRHFLKQTGLAFLTAGTLALLFVWLGTYMADLDAGGALATYQVEWVPDLGLSLSWYLDSLSLMFGMIVTGIGVAIFFYAGFYLEDLDELARFYVYLAAFAGSMLALVLAGNIIMLFIAWELTSIFSFLLIGFKGNKYEDARTAASRALMVTGAGGLALLVGLLLLGTAATGIIEARTAEVNAVVQVAGTEAGAEETAVTEEAPIEDDTLSDAEEAGQLAQVLGFELSTLLDEDLGHEIVEHPWYAAIAILIMIGAFSKSAQFPFHFWLPGAMTAPSPASAYLHSATMVKAGVYLLFRLYPTLGHSDLWTVGLMGIGLTTMLIGATFALRTRDLKGLLAYSTLSKLGALIALIGVPESHGLKAAMIGIVAHALYKGTFFLLAGTIEHATGTRNLDELGGLGKRLRPAFITAALVGLSMAGVPPLIGFPAKEFLLDELLPHGEVGILPIIIAFTASVFTVVAAMLFVWDVFVNRTHEHEYHHFHAPSTLMNVGPGLLAGASLLFGLFVSDVMGPFVKAVLGSDTKVYLIPPELNPAENTAFALSLGVLALGFLLFTQRRFWLKMPWFKLPTGAGAYAAIIRSAEFTGDQLLRLQSGKLRYYLVIITGVVSGMMFFGGYDSVRRLSISFNDPAIDILKIMLLVLTIGSTLAAIVLRRHLLAALAMGVSGYAIGGIFLLEPAPDVALVQFLVETLATVLIILMIARVSEDQRTEAMATLWRRRNDSSRIGIYRDIAISVIIGVSVGAFALAAVNDRDARIDAIREAQHEEELGLVGPYAIDDIERPITVWHMENAYKETGVTDVVASILADFRGTDTLFEITVFATASLGVLTLLTLPAGGELLTGKRISQVMRTVQTEQGEDVLSSPDGKHPSDLDAEEFGQFGSRLEVPRLSTPLTRTVAVLVLPFSLLISLFHVLYGSSGPGDGFTAGVTSGLAVALWYVVFGYFEARARLSWLRAGRLITAGLALAFGNAIVAIFVEGSFLGNVEFFGGASVAGLHLSSASVFELAIFLTVFGGVTTIMQAIAHPSEVD